MVLQIDGENLMKPIHPVVQQVSIILRWFKGGGGTGWERRGEGVKGKGEKKREEKRNAVGSLGAY